MFMTQLLVAVRYSDCKRNLFAFVNVNEFVVFPFLTRLKCEGRHPPPLALITANPREFASFSGEQLEIHGVGGVDEFLEIGQFLGARTVFPGNRDEKFPQNLNGTVGDIEGAADD